jgi:superfamily II DNA/RNA helicase
LLRAQVHQEEKILVFAMTCAAVDFWTGMLRELPQLADMRENIMGLHGKMVPAKRTGTYDRFVKLEVSELALATNKGCCALLNLWGIAHSVAS